MKGLYKLLNALPVALLLSGCAALNEGQNDYRYHDGKATYKYVSSSADGDAKLVKEGESISLHLMHGFIKGFHESSYSSSVVHGEIAIIASVFEMKDGEHMKFDGKGSKKQGRLIYFSDDVRNNGHHLNFSFLPIYGPIKYNGGPLAVQFTILELDNAGTKNVKNVLQTISQLGQEA